MIDPVAAQMGERLIRQCEGCVLHPYQDTAGNWTIGIGSIRLADGSPVTATTPPITSDQADALMLAELTTTIAEVDAMLLASATTHQRAALYSFAGCSSRLRWGKLLPWGTSAKNSGRWRSTRGGWLRGRTGDGRC